MRDEKAKLKELSNNVSDRSEAKATGIMSDLLLVNGEARQLVANPHYTILLPMTVFNHLKKESKNKIQLEAGEFSQNFEFKKKTMVFDVFSKRSTQTWNRLLGKNCEDCDEIKKLFQCMTERFHRRGILLQNTRQEISLKSDIVWRSYYAVSLD